jgi:hypothetical protein
LAAREDAARLANRSCFPYAPRRAAVRIDPGFLPVRKPVFLHYRRQRYHGRLQEAVRMRVEAAVREHLGAGLGKR